MAKKFPEHPANPERICWGCDTFCAADAMACANERSPHPAELFGDDWMRWGQPPTPAPAPAPPTQRVFLALWPQAPVCQQLADHVARWTWPDAGDRYQSADWHVTLHFLGPVSSERLAAISDALDVLVPPFELVLDTPQLWPHGLAVLCASAVPPALQQLHQQLGQQLSGLGVPLDSRPFVPHVTLARHAQAALPPADGAPVRWPVRSFALVVSTGETAARYRVLRQWPAHD